MENQHRVRDWGVHRSAVRVRRGEYMSDINALDGRIRAALERVRRQVDVLTAPATAAVAPASVAVGDGALQAQLAEERTVNAQLEERVRALKDRQDGKLRRLEATIETQKSNLLDYDREMQRLQQANAELRAVASEMREAMMTDVAEAELINRAAVAELEAVRAAQAADRAEIEVVMAQLDPLMREAE